MAAFVYTPLCRVAFQLKISKGKGTGKELSFPTDDATLGRTEDNDVVVKDNGVSKNHARIFSKGGRWFVEDLGSSNGTYVNGGKLDAPRPLKSGDAIGVGDVIFIFTPIEQTRLAPIDDEPALEEPSHTEE